MTERLATILESDLQPFCGDTSFIVRDYLSQPMHIGPWTIASNGHIAIRVPRLPGTEDTTAPESITGIFNAHSTADLGELPLFSPPEGEADCVYCQGSGVIEDDDYGWATIETCDDCRGTGKIPLLHITSVEIKEKILAARYFELIRALPFPKLAYGDWPGPYTTEGKQHPLSFTFEGGIGLLMPMRGSYDHHVRLMRPGATA